MLNTNPSRKRNAWKYSVIIPALVAFFMMYQVKTVAQVKENSKSVNTVFVSSSFFEIITAQTTDAELKKMEKAFTVDDILLKISQIKRNKKNEIIEINLAFTSKSNSKFNTTKIVKGDKPIKPIKVYIDENENNEKSVGFNEVNDTNVSFEVDRENGIFETNNVGWTIDEFTRNGKKVDLIINGKLQVKGKKIRIPNDEEIETVREISAKEVKEKYKIKVDESKLYYEVITKKEVKQTDSEASYAIELAVDYSEDESITHIERIKRNKMVDAKKALILFNGKEISYKDLDKIDEKTISSSGNSGAKYAVKKYGNKAKNGVIFINTKEYDMKNNPEFKKMYEDAEEVRNTKLKKEKKQDKIEFTSYDAGISIQMGNPNVVKMLEDVTKNSKINYENALIVLNGKIIDLEKLNSIDISSIGKITTTTASKELIKEYGEKAKNGIISIDYKSSNTTNEPFNKPIDFNRISKEEEKTEPKFIITDDGDHNVFFNGYMLKIPGEPTIRITKDSPLIFVNGKKLSNPEDFFNMDFTKIYYLEVSEKETNPEGIIKIKRIDVKTK